jgi:hypothetical protein
VRYRLFLRLIGAFGSPHAYWIVGRFSALTERHGPRGFNLNLVPRACESSCDSARRGRQLATACSLLGSPYPPTGVHTSRPADRLLPARPRSRWLSVPSPIPSLGRPRDVAPPGRHGRARHAIQTDTRPGRVALSCGRQGGCAPRDTDSRSSTKNAPVTRQQTTERLPYFYL